MFYRMYLVLVPMNEKTRLSDRGEFSFVSGSRCVSEVLKSRQCHIDDRCLAYVHEHIPDLGQSMAIEWRVSGFIMCNKLSNTNVREDKSRF